MENLNNQKENTENIEKINKLDKTETAENTENDNEFKINREMEIQAELLGTNLEKLKAEIEKAGGVDKFKEEASYKDANGKMYPVLKNKLIELASKIKDIENNDEYSLESIFGILGASLGGIALYIMTEDPYGNREAEHNLLVFYLTVGTGFLSGSLISLVNKLKDKILASQMFRKSKKLELKGKMTGVLDENYKFGIKEVSYNKYNLNIKKEAEFQEKFEQQKEQDLKNDILGKFE